MNTKIIAYYLPQYHPFKENDDWWGKGFTEWTNVAKAKPLFKGHYQPHIPADLGFYDLRLSESREAQAKMAKEAGIYGFCYWHYYFGHGKQLMERPLNEVVDLGKPDFPFCLGWANESWQSKVWNSDGTTTGKTLIEQTYQGDEDILKHFDKILSAVKDKRYIRIDNRPLFVIYRPLNLPYFERLKELWNQKLKDYNIADSFFFVAHSQKIDEKERLLSMGYDAINMMRNGAYRWDSKCVKANALSIARAKLFHAPIRLKYSTMIKFFKSDDDCAENVFPSIIPNWDHTPRSGKRGSVFVGVTPELFKQHVQDILDELKNKPLNRKIAFLKSWNEWGEGNYMEPDLKFGHGMIDAFHNAIQEFNIKH